MTSRTLARAFEGAAIEGEARNLAADRGTLKSFKAAVKVGTQLTVLAHWLPRCQNQVRTVTKVQGNGYWFTTPDHINADGTLKRAWGDFPKASELQFNGKVAVVTIGEKFWTLSFDGPAPFGRCSSCGSALTRIEGRDRSHVCPSGAQP